MVDSQLPNVEINMYVCEEMRMGNPKIVGESLIQIQEAVGFGNVPDVERWSESVAAWSTELILLSWPSVQRPTTVERLTDVTLQTHYPAEDVKYKSQDTCIVTC